MRIDDGSWKRRLSRFVSSRLSRRQVFRGAALGGLALTVPAVVGIDKAEGATLVIQSAKVKRQGAK